MVEDGVNAWRFVKGLCTVESFALFKSYCTSDGDCVVEPISQEEVVVLPD